MSESQHTAGRAGLDAADIATYIRGGLSADQAAARLARLKASNPADVVARIIALHAEQDAPLESFLDSVKPGDLEDLCATLEITLEQAREAQIALVIADRVAKVRHPFDRVGGLYEATLNGVVAGMSAGQ